MVAEVLDWRPETLRARDDGPFSDEGAIRLNTVIQSTEEDLLRARSHCQVMSHLQQWPDERYC